MERGLSVSKVVEGALLPSAGQGEALQAPEEQVELPQGPAEPEEALQEPAGEAAEPHYLPEELDLSEHCK